MKKGNQNGQNDMIMKKISALSLKIGLFLLAGSILFEGCKPAGRNIDYEDLADKIGVLVSRYHEKGEFDGTIMVADNSGIIFKGAYGMANRERNIPLRVESQFYLASVSKQFTAAAILMLVQSGEIGLDDKIQIYLTEIPELYQEITFRNLLNHTSGIPDYYNFAKLFPGFTNSDVLKSLATVEELEFDPGTKYRYSNSGYVLLSILVERITGSSFAKFLKENALQKAGLESTIIYDKYADEPEYRVTGYGNDGKLTDYKFRTTGGGGFFSNVEDLYKWHQALSSYSLINKDLMYLAYQPTILKNSQIEYYGFGWFIDPDDPEHVMHDGNLEGFRTLFDRQLDTGNVIVLLSNNSSEQLDQITRKIRKLLGS
jgi:CubicO group peptidase (beta-lactamase class C family)